MPDDAKNHDAQYAAFVARMLAALAAEEASIASHNASVTRYQGADTDTTSETVRPGKS